MTTAENPYQRISELEREVASLQRQLQEAVLTVARMDKRLEEYTPDPEPVPQARGWDPLILQVEHPIAMLQLVSAPQNARARLLHEMALKLMTAGQRYMRVEMDAENPFKFGAVYTARARIGLVPLP